MALVGGIGSGKTTELQLTQGILSRRSDAINIFMDLTDFTDLTTVSAGEILAAAGVQLPKLAKAGEQTSPEIKSAYAKLPEVAFGKTKWVEGWLLEQRGDEPDDDLVPVTTPGLLRFRLPPLQGTVAQVESLLMTLAALLLESDAQITLLIDGLDCLIYPELFRRFAEQDLRALRGTKITVIIVAPLLLWYDEGRFLNDYFDIVKHIPAAAASPEDSAFLRQILERRGARDLMDQPEINSIAKYSGGVLRDLLTLARSSAEYAYRADEDRIARSHVAAAVRQLGNRYLLGLGDTHKRILGNLAATKSSRWRVPRRASCL